VAAVFNTVQFPVVRKKLMPMKTYDSLTSYNDLMTPAKLISHYHITSNVAVTSDVTQSVFEACDQVYSPSDLSSFFAMYGYHDETMSREIDSKGSDQICVANPDDCGEANLDVQYIMSIAQNAPTTYWYADDFIPWITSVASDHNPPDVHSLSYGIEEEYITQSIVDQFDLEAIKLGLQGVTIVVASGDDGANSRDVRYSTRYCGYSPNWPASSAYVLSVGATQGPELGHTEVACQSKLDAGITSGGGFSSYSPVPQYQIDTLNNYFSNAGDIKSGYKQYLSHGTLVYGRGYPDVAMAGSWYHIIIGGRNTAASGTSASTPVIAGMLTLINAERKSLGLSKVGFVNPTLYADGGSFANDITSGDNKCSAESRKCCPDGFSAVTGWDPITGFGSVDYAKLKALLVPSHHA